MARRRRAQKRQVVPDARFGSEAVSKFVSRLMRDGKRSVAESIVYGAFDILRRKTGADPLEFFLDNIEKVKPSAEPRSRRMGGSTYQVPVDVSPDRALMLALNWVIGAARSRSEKTMQERLVGELLDVSSNKGGAIRRRDEVRRMVESNRAFSHYRPA